jgi:hypothetical protein
MDPRAPRVLRIGRDILALELERREFIAVIRDAAQIPDAAVEVAATRAGVPPIAAPAHSPSRPSPALPLAPDLLSVPVVMPAPSATAPPAPSSEVLDLAPPTGAAAQGVAPSRRATAPVPVDFPPSGAGPVATDSEPRPPRRRLSVPVLLLIVGVSLVGIAAVFFLVFAWFVWGVAVRALIIGGITLASIVSASLLKRRRLTATAEGIAALGVVLLGLDAWAVRANDFFGTGASDPAIYAGVSTLVVGVICRIWASASKLRGPDLAAALALPAGIGLLIGGMLSLEPNEAAVAGLLGASAGGLAHALPTPWSSARTGRDAVPERVTLAMIGIATLTAAAITAAVLASDTLALVVWSSLLGLVLGTTHAVSLRTRAGAEPLPGARALAGLASAVAVASVGLAGWQLALRSGEPVYGVLVAPVLAVGTAVAVDRLRTRRGGLISASVASAVIGVLSVIAVTLTWSLQTLTVASSWSTWHTAAFAAPPTWIELPYLALPSALIVSALLLAAPTLARPVLRELRAVVVSTLVLAAAGSSGTPALFVGVAVLVTAGATVALLRTSARAGWAIAATVAAVTAFTAGLATPWLWFVGVATAIALPIVVRALVRPAGATAVALALAPVAVASVAALIAPDALTAATGISGAGWQVSIALLQWIALIALAVAAATPLEPANRSALAGASYLLVTATLLWTSAGYAFIFAGTDTGSDLRGVIGDPILGIVRGVGLVAGFAVIAIRRTRIRGAAASLAAALIAPSLAAAIHETLGVMGVRDLEAVSLVPLTGAVAVVGLGAWAALSRDVTRQLRMTRLAADLGAIATALIVVWPIAAAHVWAVWAIAAVGCTGLAVTHGWAAPAGSAQDDAFATRTIGVRLALAPRRLLVWPAAVAAVLAWWAWLRAGNLEASATIEIRAIPAAAILIGFAALLVWLRRRDEAAIAVAAGLALGLWAPAVAGWSGDALRGTLVAVASTLVCLVLSWGRLRGVHPVALVGALAALGGLGLITVERALHAGQWSAAWLLLLVGVAYASALGFALDPRRRVACRRYAVAVPALALAASSVAILPSTDDAIVVAIALAALLALHIGAAGIDRLPLTTLTRWTAFAGAMVVGTGALLQGGADQIESVSLPLAAACLTGAALAAFRIRRKTKAWPSAESVVWLAGLVIATAPSIVAPIEPLRTWALILLTLAAGTGVAVAGQRIPDEGRVRVPSAVVLALAAAAMGARALLEPALASADAAANAAGAGAIAIAILLVATSREDRTTWPPVVVAAAGSVLVVAVIVTRAEGDLAPSAMTALLGGAVGVAAASVLGIRRWRGLGGVLATAGLLVGIAACVVRTLEAARTPGLEPDFWLLVAGGITVSVAAAAVRALPTSAVRQAAGIVLAFVVSLFALGEFVLLVRQAFTTDEWITDARAVLAMSVLTLATVIGGMLHARQGITLPVTAGIAAGLFAMGAFVWVGVTPVELLTAPAAIGGIAYGTWILARMPEARTCPALGLWLALLVVPSLLHDLGPSELWRVVGLGVVALGLVIAGAVLRLQAPLVLGSVVLLVHGVAQLWPWISRAYVAVPWWLWLGIGGALLIFVAATYERRVRQLKTSFVAVASLR